MNALLQEFNSAYETAKKDFCNAINRNPNVEWDVFNEIFLTPDDEDDDDLEKTFSPTH